MLGLEGYGSDSDDDKCVVDVNTTRGGVTSVTDEAPAAPAAPARDRKSVV